MNAIGTEGKQANFNPFSWWFQLEPSLMSKIRIEFGKESIVFSIEDEKGSAAELAGLSVMQLLHDEVVRVGLPHKCLFREEVAGKSKSVDAIMFYVSSSEKDYCRLSA